MNILYISDGYLDLSVFMSQVHTLCNYHAQENSVKLLALCNHRDIKIEKPKDARYKLIKVYRYPKMFIPMINKIRSYTVSKDILDLIKWADIIHCRGHIGSAFAINLLKRFSIKKPVIADIRGVVVEELRQQPSFFSNFFASQAEKLEKYIFENADFFFFVSENMRKFFMKKYNFLQENSAIFPTIVDEKWFYKSNKLRKEYRNKLGISKDMIVYIYVGGIDYWQNLDKILLKFDEINKKTPGKYFFIVLTTKPKWVYEFCKKNKIDTKNFYIDKVSYNEVGKYMNAADYGVIIRENNVINNVASPTKINEYSACGVKIINKLEQVGINKECLDVKYTPISDIIRKQNAIYKLLYDKYKALYEKL